MVRLTIPFQGRDISNQKSCEGQEINKSEKYEICSVLLRHQDEFFGFYRIPMVIVKTNRKKSVPNSTVNLCRSEKFG